MKNLQNVVLAFLYRSWCQTKRNLAWFLTGAVYQAASAATVILIGSLLGDPELTICLLIGSLIWSHLSSLIQYIAHNITWERWDDTIEFTLAAPVARMAHLLGIALYGFLRATVETSLVFLMLTVVMSMPITLMTGLQIMGVVAISSLAFYGLGMAVATLPLMSEEYGPQGADIFRGLILLISGVNYPVSMLPSWLQWISLASPATYALEACRKLAGVKFTVGLGVEAQPAADFMQILPELAALVGLGIIYIPLGSWIFTEVESLARSKGWLKRSG